MDRNRDEEKETDEEKPTLNLTYYILNYNWFIFKILIKSWRAQRVRGTPVVYYTVTYDTYYMCSLFRFAYNGPNFMFIGFWVDETIEYFFHKSFLVLLQ